MRSNNPAQERTGGPRLLEAGAAGFAGLLAAGLFAGLLDGGLPKPARADAAATAALAAAGGPALPSAPGLCFHGPGGELLDFAPAGRHCR